MAGDPSSLGTSSDPSEGKMTPGGGGRNASHICIDLMVGAANVKSAQFRGLDTFWVSAQKCR